MILDALLKLSENQALSGGGAVSTNTIDLGALTPQRDIGVGEPMAVIFGVDVAAAATGTYIFQVVESDNPDLSVPSVLVYRAVLASLLTAGALFTIEVPQNALTKRYFGVQYVLGGTTPTLTVTAFLQPHNLASVHPRHYPDAITIT